MIKKHLMSITIIIFLFVIVFFRQIYAIPASFYFWKIDGYQSKGSLLLIDSSLKAPKTEENIGYCEKIKQRYGKPDSPRGVALGTKEDGLYCGCGDPDFSPTVKYKLFNHKIIYQCWNEVFETNVIPEKLKNKD